MLKLLASILFEILKKNHFVTAAAEVDIDDSIERKRIRVSLKKNTEMPLIESSRRQIAGQLSPTNARVRDSVW